MPTELDFAIDATISRLMKDDGPLSIRYIEKFGVKLPMFEKAPADLAQYYAFFCATHGDKEFLVDGDTRLTFAQTFAAARKVAGALVTGYDLKKGDRVGIAARNSANWVILNMAISLAGGVTTMLNGWWTGQEMAEGINLVSCRYVLADDKRAVRLSNLDIGDTQVIEFQHGGDPADGLSAILAKGGDEATPLPQIVPEDNATILFTSGSTGRSKGAYSNHRSVVQGAMSYVSQTMVFFEILSANGANLPEQPSALVNVPLFHVTASVPLVLQSFAIGRKLVLMPKWDAEIAMQWIEREKISYFVGVPLMSMEIATHPNKDKYDLSSCTALAAGGAPRPVEHVKRIRKEFPNGYPLLGYGLTETNGVGCGNFTENYLAKPASTGPATKPLVELEMLDDDGNILPQGEVGEVCIRSIANFTGYWNNEEATAQAITKDGWFRTGDLGYLDEDKYLFIVDRKKDIIIRGGENISCAEVESAAYENPAIAELAVIGIEDQHFGEVPGIIYCLKDGENLSQEELTGFLKERLAPFKIPVHFWQADTTLPRLGTQKIDRVVLKKQYNEMVLNG